MFYWGCFVQCTAQRIHTHPYRHVTRVRIDSRMALTTSNSDKIRSGPDNGAASDNSMNTARGETRRFVGSLKCCVLSFHWHWVVTIEAAAAGKGWGHRQLRKLRHLRVYNSRWTCRRGGSLKRVVWLSRTARWQRQHQRNVTTTKCPSKCYFDSIVGQLLCSDSSRGVGVLQNSIQMLLLFVMLMMMITRFCWCRCRLRCLQSVIEWSNIAATANHHGQLTDDAWQPVIIHWQHSNVGFWFRCNAKLGDFTGSFWRTKLLTQPPPTKS